MEDKCPESYEMTFGTFFIFALQSSYTIKKIKGNCLWKNCQQNGLISS